MERPTRAKFSRASRPEAPRAARRPFPTTVPRADRRPFPTTARSADQRPPVGQGDAVQRGLGDSKEERRDHGGHREGAELAVPVFEIHREDHRSERKRMRGHRCEDVIVARNADVHDRHGDETPVAAEGRRAACSPRRSHHRKSEQTLEQRGDRIRHQRRRRADHQISRYAGGDESRYHGLENAGDQVDRAGSEPHGLLDRSGGRTFLEAAVRKHRLVYLVDLIPHHDLILAVCPHYLRTPGSASIAAVSARPSSTNLKRTLVKQCATLSILSRPPILSKIDRARSPHESSMATPFFPMATRPSACISKGRIPYFCRLSHCGRKRTDEATVRDMSKRSRVQSPPGFGHDPASLTEKK